MSENPMNEADQVPSETPPVTSAAPRRQFYAPWLLGVLVVFMVCEVLLFSWKYEAGDYATGGFFCGGFFAACRYLWVSKGKASWAEVIVVVIIALILFALVLPPFECARECARRSACFNTLKQLGLAIHNYVDEYKQFPPAFVVDETGQPMHSWRTLLLPFIEMGVLHDRLDLEQPWDAQENLAAVIEVDGMQCPSVESSGKPEYRTDYVVVVGDDTIWPIDGTSRMLEDVTAGLDNAAILIEISDSDIPWYEPRDVKLEDLLSGKVSWDKGAVHTVYTAFYYPGPYRHVLFADGSVHMVPGNLTPDQIRRLFSITEPFDVEKELISPAPRPIVFRHVVFYVWLATLFLQFAYIFFPVKKHSCC